MEELGIYPLMILGNPHLELAFGLSQNHNPFQLVGSPMAEFMIKKSAGS